MSITTTLSVIDGLGAEKRVAAEQNNASVLTPHSVPEVAGLPVSNANPLPVEIIEVTPPSLTAAHGTSFKVVTGGTPVIAITGDSMTTGGFIANPPGGSSIYVDMVNMPATADAPGTFGTTEEILPGDRWTAPGPLTGNVWVNAPGSNQTFTVVIY